MTQYFHQAYIKVKIILVGCEKYDSSPPNPKRKKKKKKKREREKSIDRKYLRNKKIIYHQAKMLKSELLISHPKKKKK